jgi:hypothetical protein
MSWLHPVFGVTVLRTEVLTFLRRADVSRFSRIDRRGRDDGRTLIRLIPTLQDTYRVLSLSLSLSLSLLVQKCKRDRGSYYVYMYSTVVIQVINEAFEYATHAVRLEWPETILTVTKTNDSYRRSYVWGGGTGILCYYIT